MEDPGQLLPPSTLSQFEAGPIFFACLTGAVALLYLFCRQKFNERSVVGNDDYAYQLLPSELSTRQEYNKGFLTYFGAMVFVVVALSLLGAKDLEFFGISLKGISANVTPLAIAVLLVGVIPNVPVLQEIEKRLRQYAHEMAYIPRSALATAEKLSTAEFDFTKYADDPLHSDEMRGIEASDFKQPRRTLEYAWARLGCLVYEQKSLLESGADSLDTSLLRAYRRDLELIEKNKRSMEPEIVLYRIEKAKNPGYTNRDLHTAIRNDLYKLYILLGCAVRLKKQPHNDINLALERFGFRLGKAEVERTYADLKLVGLFVIGSCILALQFGAALLGQFGLWEPSVVFPTSFEQPFTDTVWALIPYAAAIMVADFLRRRAIKNSAWFEAGQAKGSNYVRVALLCGAAGFAGMTAWGAVFAWPTIAGLKSDIPYALIAMVTGGFYAWHLDNVEMNTRPPQWRERSYQALLTALCGFIAAAAAWSILLGGPPRMVVDKILLIGTISLAIGCVLGWYVPKAATATRTDPLAQAIKDRVGKLETLAIARLGDAAARQWLDRPHPALGLKSPRVVAMDVEGFDHAMSLLQGPQSLAA